MTNVFIDGSAGTTGLRIYERLNSRTDINLIILPEDIRKDISARKDALNSADIAFLCLPDAAAIEAVSLLDNNKTAIIDTSTAHRVDPKWVYGFPELCGGENYEKIANSKRIANPGCHASGFNALVEPLVLNGILDKNANLSCTSLTGYSGGGKKMIAEYEDADRNRLLDAPRMYGLTQQHKHLKEMKTVCGIESMPAFCPIVAPFYSGMEVIVSVFADQIKGSLADINSIYAEYYKKGLVKYAPNSDEEGFISANKYSGRDDMEISAFGNDERIVLVSRFDNLGKGASGAAIQNMNILLGVDEAKGLDI